MGKGLPGKYIKQAHREGASNPLKRAWQLYRGSKTQHKTKKRETKTAPKKPQRKGRGRRILGSMGFKSILFGIIGLTGLKWLQRKFLPGLPAQYVDPLATIGTGVMGKVFNLPTKQMLGVGVVQGASTLITDLIMPNGLVTLPGIGGAGAGNQWDV